MLLEKTYKQIADEFIGDNESPLYKYKSGPELVDFFNEYFNVKDYYGQDFPSRSYYVVEYLRALDSEGKLEEFFSIIQVSFNEGNSYEQSMEEKILTQHLDSELVKYSIH